MTDSAEAAVKGSSNTAGGEEIGAKKPEGYTLLEERRRGREGGDRDPELKKYKRKGGEFPQVVLLLCFSSHSSFV